jgi:FKBP12-rapamycin complex-associated protein
MGVVSFPFCAGTRGLEWEWFHSHSVQVLILRELAVRTPTLFYQQIQQFFDSIFIAIRDPKVRPLPLAALKGADE